MARVSTFARAFAGHWRIVEMDVWDNDFLNLVEPAHLYLVQGFLGLPVFASGGGGAYLLGPRGGFLVAFLPMALLIGMAADQGWKSRPLLLFTAMIIADALVFGLGFAWLLVLSGSAGWIDQSAPVASAWRGAVEPFLVWDALKMGIAAALVSVLPTLRVR